MVVIRFTAKDGSELLFREPMSNDAPMLMRFINAFVDESKSGLMISRKVTLAQEKAWLKDRLAAIKNRKCVMLTVEKDGMIVGNCDASRLTGKSSHVAEIGIALSKDIRGIGVGEGLMSSTIELAGKRMRGLEMMYLKAFDYNDRACALYKKLGFVEVGRIPKANKEGPKYFDDVLMVKSL